MKLNRILLAFVICTIAAFAQTQGNSTSVPTSASSGQIHCSTSSNQPQVLIAIPVSGAFLPSVTMTCVPLAAGSFVLTAAGLSIVPQAGGTTAVPAFVDGETPSGAANGTNVTFTLANTPNPVTSLALYRNGIRQMLGVDYAISGASITFLVTGIPAPTPTDILLADYRH